MTYSTGGLSSNMALHSGPTNDQASHGLALGRVGLHSPFSPPDTLTNMLFLQLLSDAHGFSFP